MTEKIRQVRVSTVRLKTLETEIIEMKE